MMKVREMLGLVEAPSQEQTDHRLVLPKCKMGLEYEWESVNFPREIIRDRAARNAGFVQDDPLQMAENKAFSKYQMELAAETLRYFLYKHDGSLRGPSAEFVFREPFSGSRVTSAIDVMDNLQRAFAFTGSFRTSMHVHMDMRDVTFPTDIEKFGALYCVLEPFLYKFVGSNRECSNYCVPWYAHPQHYEAYFGTLAINNKPGRDIAQGLRGANQLKYAGLNFFSLGNFGTVEFRQAPVTMQKDKILLWINILQSMKKYVQEKEFTSIDLIEICNKRGAELFLEDVFGQLSKYVIKNPKSVQDDFLLGLGTLYQFVAIAATTI